MLHCTFLPNVSIENVLHVYVYILLYTYNNLYHKNGNISSLFQVRFHNLSTVVRLATQGENNAWVTLYRLATSVDCVNFNNLLDGLQITW